MFYKHYRFAPFKLTLFIITRRFSVIFMRKLTLFDSERDQWYYQSKIYIDPKSNTLYYELKEFRISLSKNSLDKVPEDSFEKEDKDDESNRVFRINKELLSQLILKNLIKEKSNPEHPSISFFSDKVKTLGKEIERINKDLEERERIEKQFERCIDCEIKELKRLLHEISEWPPGEKHTIEAIRLDLRKQILNLKREKRLNKLNFWRDRVFERRDRRSLIFEYKAAKKMLELIEGES